MTEKPNPYNHAKVYKLVHLGEPQYYYFGSTCNTLTKRLSGHKRKAKLETERKMYKIFNTLGWNNVDIVFEKDFNVQNKEQLNREEYNYIKASINDPLCLNSNVTGTIFSVNEQKKQWVQEHPEQRKLSLVKYYQNHKEKENERTKRWYYENRQHASEQKKIYLQNHKEQTKLYYQNNKEKINEQNKKYRQEKREKIIEINKLYYQKRKEELSVKIKCDCGSEIRKAELTRHLQTKKHIAYIANKQIENESLT